jgi:FkbM family methyltransferase
MRINFVITADQREVSAEATRAWREHFTGSTSSSRTDPTADLNVYFKDKDTSSQFTADIEGTDVRIPIGTAVQELRAIVDGIYHKQSGQSGVRPLLDLSIRHFRSGTDDDRFVIPELIAGDMYRIAFLQTLLPSEGIMYDCGGHIGVFSCLFHKHFPAYEISIFEPAEANFQVLIKNCSGPRYTVHPAGISTEVGRATLFSPVDPMQTGRFTLTPQSSGRPADEINVVSFFELILKTSAPTIVVKLDIEGHEADILNAAPMSVLEKIKLLVLEEHHKPIDHTRLVASGFELLFNPWGLDRHFVYLRT